MENSYSLRLTVSLTSCQAPTPNLQSLITQSRAEAKNLKVTASPRTQVETHQIWLIAKLPFGGSEMYIG